MSIDRIANVRLVEGGGIFLDDAGQEHFIAGYGGGSNTALDLDPRIDLTKPIWEQVQKLAELDAHQEEA